jgi:predicted anti-sigma-YlaC factor YlaD
LRWTATLTGNVPPEPIVRCPSRTPSSRDLVCQQAVELVTDYLEGALSRRQRCRFEAHLRACPHCQAYLDQMRATITAVGQVEPEDLDTATQDDLIDLFRRYQQE